MNEPTSEEKLPLDGLAGCGAGGAAGLGGAAGFGAAGFAARAALRFGAALRADFFFADDLRADFFAADLRAPTFLLRAVFAALRDPFAFFRPRAFFDLAAFAMIILRCCAVPNRPLGATADPGRPQTLPCRLLG
jgi:hypothetical protein